MVLSVLHDTNPSWLCTKADYSIFTRLQGTSFIALLVYVDDILIASNDNATVNYNLYLPLEGEYLNYNKPLIETIDQ